MMFYFSSSFPQIKQKSSGRTGGNFKRSFLKFSLFCFLTEAGRIQKRETESFKFIVKLLNSINYGII